MQKLTKAQRLSKPSEFKRIYGGKFWGSGQLFSFNVLPSPHSRLGVTVSKKVSKSAVIRNKIRRQVKEFYRLNQSRFKNSDLVITARPSCGQASDEERWQSLQELEAKFLKWRRWYDRNHTKTDELD